MYVASARFWRLAHSRAPPAIPYSPDRFKTKYESVESPSTNEPCPARVRIRPGAAPIEQLSLARPASGQRVATKQVAVVIEESNDLCPHAPPLEAGAELVIAAALHASAFRGARTRRCKAFVNAAEDVDSRAGGVAEPDSRDHGVDLRRDDGRWPTPAGVRSGVRRRLQVDALVAKTGGGAPSAPADRVRHEPGDRARADDPIRLAPRRAAPVSSIRPLSI
jgi:hypothetical protein